MSDSKDWKLPGVDSDIIELTSDMIRVARPDDEIVTACARRIPSSSDDTPWFEGSIKPIGPPPVPGDAPASPSLPPWLEDRGEFARGGMGTIRRARDRRLRRVVAVKVLDRTVGHVPIFVRRFREEAQITGQLDHPNIVPVHELWDAPDGGSSFSMKLVRGVTLGHILGEKTLGERTDRDMERYLQIFLKVCDAVSFAHSRGVLHRDIKPDNIMVGSHGQVYLMDWGCAQILAGARGDETGEPVTVERDPSMESLDTPGTVIGTGAYMAPEQALARASLIDERTDVYLLGSLLYAILTRNAPHRGRTFVESVQRAQKGEVQHPQELAGAVRLPPRLCQITMKAMDRDAERRYQTVQALQDDVEHCLHSGLWFGSASFSKGTLILREGELGDSIYIITQGTCEAFKMQGGRRVTLRRMGPGDVFGEMAVIASRRRTANVEAIDDVTATVVTRDALEHGLHGTSWMGAIVRALSERFQELDTRLTHLRQMEEADRVGDWLRGAMRSLGSEIRDGVWQAPWSRVFPVLWTTFGVSEEEVLSFATAWSDLRVDPGRDFIELALDAEV